MTEDEIEKVIDNAIEHARDLAGDQDEHFPSPGMVEAIVRFTITALDQHREGKANLTPPPYPPYDLGTWMADGGPIGHMGVIPPLSSPQDKKEP